MFKNYLIIAIRTLLKHKGYTLINIAGLTVGLVCCILTLAIVRHELSYDRFHKYSDRIYRILRERSSNNKKQISWLTSGALARALESELPEVDLTSKCRIYRVHARTEDRALQLRQGQIDNDFFKLFNFPFLQGNPQTALQSPYSAVLSSEAARRLFGNQDPLGKIITIEERYYYYYYGGDYTVTGIVDLPRNSSIQFDLLHATEGRTEEAKFDWTIWQGRVQQAGILTFIRLKKSADLRAIKTKLPAFIERHIGKEVRDVLTYRLQPLLRWHLYSQVDYAGAQYRFWDDGDIRSEGDIRNLYIFSAVALLILLILLIACVNFVNLATARSVGRTREVGMRKVFGAHRRQLIGQFLGESLFLAFLSLLPAALLAPSAMARLNDLTQNRYPLTPDTLLTLLPGLLLGVGLIGLIAGFYPALYLSAFHPARVFQTSTQTGRGWLRKSLVIFQFSISILLIIATQVVDRQLTYIQNKKLGFDREHILILPIFLKDRDHKTNDEPWLAARYNVIKKTFTDHPNIHSASAFRFLPGRGGGFVRIVKPEGQENTEWRMPVQEADESFFDTLGIPLLAGRTFSPEVERDRTHAYIINETAVKFLGWTVQNAVGKRFGRARSDEDAKGTVIGVVQDFHYASLREQIAPAAFAYRQWFYDYLALRIQNVETTRPFLEKTWKSFMPPDKPFTTTFLNDEINQVYKAERRFGKTATAFSTLAVFLACLGLFGLASFTAEMRTREFGIRKVLGASAPGLVLLLSREFTRLVLFANLLAWPLAYYAMNQWLQGFAYRVDLGLSTFLIGGLLALLIALLTVSYQALKAATTNPIDTLRYE